MELVPEIDSAPIDAAEMASIVEADEQERAAVEEAELIQV
jgi:hypothetical protein